jgi:hypothetical protein
VVLKGGPVALRDLLRRESRWAWDAEPPHEIFVQGIDDQALSELYQPKVSADDTHLALPLTKHVYRVVAVEYRYEYLGELVDGRYVP